MCGIIGFNSKNDTLGREMCDSILHRGPDDAGVFCDDYVTIGNRRLSIIDVTTAGHQPMENREQTVWIVYNGEVYNFLDLKNDLLQQGCIFNSNTDTEVLLYGYERYGISFFSKLRGMWAVAIYDQNRKKLILARDYFGIKPLYYFWNDHDLVFASEIKAIKKFLESKKQRVEFSRDAIRQYFILGYTVHPFTVFKHIKKVRPGEIISFDLKTRSFSSEFLRWEKEMEEQRVLIKSEEIIPRFEKIMEESVRCHIMSDVPVGVFLSGGSDSTLIALMMKRLGIKFCAFTMRIQGRKDADYAKKIAKFLGLTHEEIAFDRNALERSYEECWMHLDEPIADTSLLTGLAVSRVASMHAKVVLTGEGGDEMFLGYPKYELFHSLRNSYRADWIVKLMDSLRTPSSVFYMKYARPILRRMRLAYFKTMRKDLLGVYLETSARDFDIMSRVFLHEYLYRLFKNKDLDPAFFDYSLYLPNNLLYKIDFVTMAHSIEGRVPFLDKKVFAFSQYLSSEWKLKNRVGKRIIKEYLAKNLPSELIFRKKEGFSLPPTLYELDIYKDDLRRANLFARDVFDECGLDSGVFKKLSRGDDFFALFNKKFPDFLFATLVFYKSTSKIL